MRKTHLLKGQSDMCRKRFKKSAYRCSVPLRLVVSVIPVVAILMIGNSLLYGQSGGQALFIDNSGRVGIGKSSPGAELDVAGTVRAKSFEGDGAVPKGLIAMWSGAADSIPAGWWICNGEKGTPDLRGRFILGAGQGKRLIPRKVNDMGGKENHVLTIDEMPAHNHGAGGAHNHRIEAFSGDRAYGDLGPKDQQVARDMNYKAGKVKHTLSNGTHTHKAQGRGKAHPIMPPYYVLAFIMKLGD